MKKTLIRIAAFLLAFVLLSSASPVSFADEGSVIPALMKRFDSRVTRPKAASVLDEPARMAVRSRYGNLIYVYSSPSGSVISSAKEGSSVIVYARQNGYALGLVENTIVGGWMSEKLLVEADGAVPDSYRIDPSAADKPAPETAAPLSLADIASLLGKGVRAPKESDLLPQAEIRYVESTYGNCIYALNAPHGSIVSTVSEGAKVTVYARKSGFSLAQVDGSSVTGWMADMFLEPASREGRPNPSDTLALKKDVYRPEKGEYLDEYLDMYVKSNRGVRVYVLNDPKKDPDEREIIGYAYEQESCRVIARVNGLLFVITESGLKGWIAAEYLVFEY